MDDHRKKAGQAGPQMVPMPAPGWDASRPADSFRAFARSVHEMAKQVLLRDAP